MLRHITLLNAVFERRPPKYMFGTQNYGDIPGTLNCADGDPFDVFAPGTATKLKIGEPYRIVRVYGVYMLEDGNHKVCVGVKHAPIDVQRARAEVRRYCTRYTAFTRVKGEWVPMHRQFRGIHV